MRLFVPRHALLKFYHAFIHSQLNYLILVWGRATISLLRRLQTLQNRCLKTIFNLPIRHSTAQLYRDNSHKILSLSLLCDLQTIFFVFDNLHSNNSRNLQFNTRTRIHNTRQIYYLQRCRSLTSLGQRRISFIGPTKYNNLPEQIKIIPNRNIFKTKLIQHLKQTIN